MSTMDVITPALLSSADAATYMGMKSAKTLCNWRYQGKGPRYIRLGEVHSRVVYRVSDLDDFIAASERKTGEPSRSRVGA